VSYAPLDIDARGIRVRFHEHGEGKTLLLIHDFLSNRDTWTRTFDPLSAKQRVLALDLPGFGESEVPNPSKFSYTFAGFADAILDVTAALGLSRVSLLGHGLGASIALSLAAKHPSVVENLVLEAPLVLESNFGSLLSLASMPVLGRLLFKQAFGAAAFGRMVLGKESEAERMRRYEQFDTPAARESAHATFIGMLDTRALVAVLPRITTRTLIVWGRNDTRSPAMHARLLSRQVAQSRLEILDTGHTPHEELPLEFAEIVQDFLTPQPRRRAGSASSASMKVGS
jgi:pimeloyl-ACP methyl ester carboxylesterase